MSLPACPRRRPLTLTTVAAVALALGVTTVGVSLAVQPAAAAEALCTTYDTDGFTILVAGDVRLGHSETEGSIAVGGDLLLPRGNHALIHTSSLTPTGYTLPVVDGDPTRLLVGGTVDPASGGWMEVSSRGYTSDDQVGAIKVGVTDDLTLTARSGVDRLHRVDGGQDSAPWVDVNDRADQTLTGDHRVSYPAAGAVVDGLFDGLVAQGEALRDADDDTVAVATLQNGVITLTPDAVNVLSVSAAQLRSYTALGFGAVEPSATTSLVVNVTGVTGSVRIPDLRGGSMPGNPTGTDPNPWAPYVTWNLTGLGSVEVTGALVTGTLLAPDVSLRTDVTSRIEGQIIARSLVTAGGEAHHYHSAGACGTTPTETPTAEPTGTPTTEPTGTPTTEPTGTPTTEPTGTPTTEPTGTPTTEPTQTTTAPSDATPLPPVTSTGTPTSGLAETAPTGTATSAGVAGPGSDGPSGDLAVTGATLAPLVAGGVLVLGGLVLLTVRRVLSQR